MFTRRRFLAAACAAGAPLAWAQAPPERSPLRRGPHPVGRALLGVTPATAQPPMPPPVELSEHPGNAIHCANGLLDARRPGRIAAAIYYPALEESTDMQRPIAGSINRERRHPLLLYAHAKRRWLTCPEHVPPGLDTALSDPGLDFRRTERMLSHIASHGFVVAAPDLGWLVQTFEEGSWDGVGGLPRARILVALYAALAEQAQAWFGGRVDVERLGLIGHSSGALACIAALERLGAAKALAVITPAAKDDFPVRRSPATLIITASLELQLVRDPAELFREAPPPKVMVRLEGANHLGFTELCTADNRTCIDGDPPALIERNLQQDVAAAYVVAMMRLRLSGDRSMRRYLDGRATLGAHLPVRVSAKWR